MDLSCCNVFDGVFANSELNGIYARLVFYLVHIKRALASTTNIDIAD